MVIAAAFMLRAKPGQQPAVAGGAPAPDPLAPTLPPGVKATAVRAGLVSAPATNGAHLKPVTGSGTLAALKEELFALETERLEGKITDAEYAEHKAALEVLLKRALAREVRSEIRVGNSEREPRRLSVAARQPRLRVQLRPQALSQLRIRTSAAASAPIR